MTRKPGTTQADSHYLRCFGAAEKAGTPVLMYRDPAKPDAGVSRPALGRLLSGGLVQRGDHTGRGRPIHITQLGHQDLDAVKE